MEGATLEKLWRLGRYLAARPGEIPRYLRDRALRRQSPSRRRLPWYSYPAIEFLEGWLRPDMTVFEWGSGGSTLFSAARVRRVVAIEDDPAWAAQVREALARDGLANAEIRLTASDLGSREAFAASAYARALDDAGPEGWDLIAVDGSDPLPGAPLRPVCFAAAERAVRPGGAVLLDDSWRYPELLARNRARELRDFRGTGPCRPGVTSTALFFY